MVFAGNGDMALLMQTLMFRIIYTLKTVTEHVEQQYKRLQSYKVLMNLTYIFSYVIITPVIIAFFLYMAQSSF